MLLITVNLFAQSPEKMSYQAVLRDSSDELVKSTDIGTQISILQGSSNGSVVYVETQTPTTNENGLVSLEIGTGNVEGGNDFASINWENGPFFIKTETDLTGGTNYTVSGTSQLLSVPYALHAKTAETFSDTSNLAKTYEVGDFAQGGVVVWVDETKQHGLVCTITDVIDGTIRWFAGTYGATRATGDGVFGGEKNTAQILSSQIAIGDDGDDYAASICHTLVVNQNGVNYGDWYLPTVEELNLIGEQKNLVDSTSTANGGTSLSTSPYWSSTELNENEAIFVTIVSAGVSDDFINKAALFQVRAVRAF